MKPYSAFGSSDDPHRYDDIRNLPHHQSFTRPRMSLHDRAAQFAPFAALTGYDDMVAETARLTDCEIQLDEGEKLLLDQEMALITGAIEDGSRPVITVTYFEPDGRKAGGVYARYTGTVKRIDSVGRKIVFFDGDTPLSGMEILIDRISAIQANR